MSTTKKYTQAQRVLFTLAIIGTSAATAYWAFQNGYLTFSYISNDTFANNAMTKDAYSELTSGFTPYSVSTAAHDLSRDCKVLVPFSAGYPATIASAMMSNPAYYSPEFKKQCDSLIQVLQQYVVNQDNLPPAWLRTVQPALTLSAIGAIAKLSDLYYNEDHSKTPAMRA